MLLMDHFSSLKMFANMGYGTDTDHTVRQLKRWFSTFIVARSSRCDNGPPFFSMGFKDFCDKYCIDLQHTSPYNLVSFGAAERGVGLVKGIMKKTEEKGLCFEEALAAIKNTRNESGFSPNQLFFLRNLRDPSLPNLLAEPVVEEMMEARDRVRARAMVKKDEDNRGWPKLHRGDLVRGRHPKTKEWSMKGEVVEVVHGERAVFVVMDDRSSRLYKREDVRLDTTKRYQENKEVELNSQLVGTELE